MNQPRDEVRRRRIAASPRQLSVYRAPVEQVSKDWPSGSTDVRLSGQLDPDRTLRTHPARLLLGQFEEASWTRSTR